MDIGYWSREQEQASSSQTVGQLQARDAIPNQAPGLAKSKRQTQKSALNAFFPARLAPAFAVHPFCREPTVTVQFLLDSIQILRFI